MAWINVIDTVAKANKIEDSFFDQDIPVVVCDEICNGLTQFLASGDDYNAFHCILGKAYIAGRLKYQNGQFKKGKDDGLSCVKSVAMFGHKESLLFLLRNGLVSDLEKQCYAQRLMRHPRVTDQERAEMQEVVYRFKERERQNEKSFDMPTARVICDEKIMSEYQQPTEKPFKNNRRPRRRKPKRFMWVTKKIEEDGAVLNGVGKGKKQKNVCTMCARTKRERR